MSCACQAIWMRNILEELHFKQEGPTPIYCDNTSAIILSNNPVEHRRSKHIDVKYHFFCDLTKDAKIILIYCKSEEQVADRDIRPYPGGTDWIGAKSILAVMNMNNAHFVTLEILLHEDIQSPNSKLCDNPVGRMQWNWAAGIVSRSLEP
ncbi:hypothetical protein MTR67_043306 [Solanum verrucosum]|uniref:Retrovirus-related Pol polyprotein from transposon TNT 1-94 n=1 Tax=Solanum verrucosum TaxID=315347 RepID=A0AAF0ZSJ8_SOLVR|nr:hypothetical protein MTR67_043306 [Solanum verrucosum]